MPTRRQLLAAAGAGAAGSTAGCMGVLGDDGNDATAEAAESDPEATVRLEELSVQNNHEEPHRVQLAVEADGEVLHLDTYDLDPAGGAATVEADWGEEAGVYRIHTRLDDGEVRSADVTDDGEGSTCVRALVRIDSGGTLATFWNDGDCA